MTHAVHINGTEYLYTTQVSRDDTLRKSFNALTQSTFDFSFEDWYQKGYWGDRYRPHALLLNGEIAANISVNLMKFRLDGVERPCIQLGTVMTRPELRGQGLSRYLMERVLREWRDKGQVLYLFANDSVLDFYPRFGFVQGREYRYSLPLAPARMGARRLDVGKEEDRALFLGKHRLGNPFSRLDTVNDDDGLIMFYCGGSLKDHVYYSEAYDVALVAEYEGDHMLCYGVFGKTAAALSDILCACAGPGTKRADLGFTPLDTAGMAKEPFHEENTTLFVLDPEDCFLKGRELMFPLLSHT